MATLSVSELAIRKTAVQHNVPESIVELVIAHKSKAMYEALYLHKSVEDSGFGKFTIRNRVVLNKLHKLEVMIDALERSLNEDDLSQKDRDKKLGMLKDDLAEQEYLRSKI